MVVMRIVLVYTVRYLQGGLMTKAEARQIVNDFIDTFETDDEFDYFYKNMMRTDAFKQTLHNMEEIR